MADKKEKSIHPPALLELYDRLISNVPGEERKGATMPYTAVNGNMYSFINKEGVLALRLPVDERELFIKKYKTKLSIEHGSILKEYVSVPEKLFEKTRELSPYFVLSNKYAQSLKPKPTKKK